MGVKVCLQCYFKKIGRRFFEYRVLVGIFGPEWELGTGNMRLVEIA